MKNHLKLFASLLLATGLAACSQQAPEEAVSSAPEESAEAFIARVNEELEGLREGLGAAGWVRATYITEDTAILSAAASERYAEWHSHTVAEALKYDGQELSAETHRALGLIKLGASLPSPNDAAKRKELARLATDLKGMYGAGKYCRSDNDCLSLADMETILAESRDYDQLLEAWKGWRTISPPMRDQYARYVELANEGARELGYGNL